MSQCLEEQLLEALVELDGIFVWLPLVIGGGSVRPFRWALLTPKVLILSCEFWIMQVQRLSLHTADVLMEDRKSLSLMPGFREAVQYPPDT